TSFTIPVKLGKKMPGAAKKTPVDLTVTGIDLVRAAVFSGRPGPFLHNPTSVKNAEFAQWRATSCLRHLEPKGTTLRRPA
ncbi:hypothetical protein, partial [Bacillus mycoides]|uniref:hypothetical protein n=1 Tax=Bacillus mycoides TaxID=1405 RepID=UPI002112B821